MKKLYIVLVSLLLSFTQAYAFTWDSCAKKYEKAKQFSHNIKLTYVYLKATKSCLIKFKNTLENNPDPEFTVKAMKNNILMLDKYIQQLIPSYNLNKNTIEEIPKYLNLGTSSPIANEEYKYFKRFYNCNGIHANNKIYTAKHCYVENSKNIRYDLSYLESKTKSKLQTAKLDLNKKGTFKYYSMSKEGMFFNSLLQEKNCKFYKAKNTPNGLNRTLDLADLEKEEEIRSTCLAIPSNSGGGVFQDEKLVGIISKTVFNDKEFMYSVVEPIK